VGKQEGPLCKVGHLETNLNVTYSQGGGGPSPNPAPKKNFMILWTNPSLESLFENGGLGKWKFRPRRTRQDTTHHTRDGDLVCRKGVAELYVCDVLRGKVGIGDSHRMKQSRNAPRSSQLPLSGRRTSLIGTTRGFSPWFTVRLAIMMAYR
jgi:hypothetical protein